MAFTSREIRSEFARSAGVPSHVRVRYEGMELTDIEDLLVREVGITSFTAAKKLYREARKRVPYDSGDLYDSAKVARSPRVRGMHQPELFEVSFGDNGPWYAQFVHDNKWDPPLGPESFNRPRKPGQPPRPHPETPKQARYLADPAELMKDELFKEVQRSVAKVVKEVAVIAAAKMPRLVKKAKI